nr:lysosomal protective protein-like isoform X2 [Rhipicephalus microplus]
MMLTKIVLAVSALPLLRAASPAVEVTELPGLVEPINFRHYSGFLHGAEGRMLHYWFLESERSPTEDPVLLWMNGGPGCSSLVGLSMELGPFRIDPSGVNVTLNPFSWNKVANVIFLEVPAGVGYSYDPSGSNSSDDFQATEDNYRAVLEFFDNFPQFRQNEFYVTGESYAGVFVPLLTQRLLEQPHGINLKGYAIGNGAVDFEIHGKAIMFFGYYHGLFGDDLWDDVTTHCCNGTVSKETVRFRLVHPRPNCVDPVNVAYDIILEEGLNLYNLYVPCEIKTLPRELLSRRHPEITSQYATKKLLTKTLGLRTSDSDADHNCYNQDNLLLYYNRRDVIEALHVEQTPHVWVPCSKVLNFTEEHLTMREVVQQLQAQSGHLKALIYHGDVDMACPFQGGEWFTRSLGYKSTSLYRMWHVGPLIAGFVENFANNITFVTVKGAGHMVPMDKPLESLVMITNFLTNQTFK